MAENEITNYNITFGIFTTVNGNETTFPVGGQQLVLRKATYESKLMSFDDKITGDVVCADDTLVFTPKEYVKYKGVKYHLVNPPTFVKEGTVTNASSEKGLAKYTLEFYHPMVELANYPFADVAVTNDETQYLSEDRDFSWVGRPQDLVEKLNKNLQNTNWKVEIAQSSRSESICDVIQFQNQTIADVIKTLYDTFKIPFVFDNVDSTDADYEQGKYFKVCFGKPVNELYINESAKQNNEPYVFRFGQGLGLKNKSLTPKNNKIVTRLAANGSENNITYGYPQIPWRGDENAKFTYGDHAGLYEIVTIGNKTFTKVVSYPLYMGVYEGQWVKLIKHPFTRKKLMPSSYRTSLINKVSPYVVFVEDENTHRLVAPQETTVNESYNPDLTLIDYIDAESDEHTTYPNPIIPNNPSFEHHEFEKIKPELNADLARQGQAASESEHGQTVYRLLDCYPINNDLTRADEWDSELKENSDEYKQNYFKVKLPELDFDLYACASLTEEMKIYLRTGACQGCTFNVKIDWDYYKSIFYNSDGEFSPNGWGHRDTTTFPNSTETEIELILEKDLETFGTIMPNEYQYPKFTDESVSPTIEGDVFVILGISLPQSYVTEAEERLDNAMKQYLLENNIYHYEYPFKFDEHFLTQHPFLLEQIKNNCKINFSLTGDANPANATTLYIKSLTIKYGENALPKYDITLDEDMEVTLNQIGQVSEDVSRIDQMVSMLQQQYGNNVWLELAKKLSKERDDTAAGNITFLKGLQVGRDFTSGLLGEGGIFRKDADGKTYIEVDKIYARIKAIFDTVEIRQDTHTSGNRIVSSAGIKCVRVEEIKDNNNNVEKYRCYFLANDGERTITNDFVINDLAFHHQTLVRGNISQRRYWRKVVGKSSAPNSNGEHYIDLSNVEYENVQGVPHDIPQAQDDIIQLGNTDSTNHADRQGAIMEYVNGEDSPSYRIYQGINGFSLVGKEKVSFGVDSRTHKAFMNVSGDFRFGDTSDDGSYIKYNSTANGGQLDIKARIDASSVVNGKSLNAIFQGIQDQIDGQIETWFYNGQPSSSTLPESEWTTTEIKINHVGDLYYDNETGYAYRFMVSGEGTEQSPYVFSWSEISDSAVVKALSLSREKKRIFTATPTDESVYDVGDLWVNATFDDNDSNHNRVIYNNDVLRCVTAKAQGGTFSIDHWQLASKYTDDAKFNGYINQILNGSGTNIDNATLNVANALRVIKNALNEDTIIDGGLILTSLIAMRKFNQQTQQYNTWSGISGQYDETNNGKKGHGIAAWYGGAMADREDAIKYLSQDELQAYNQMTDAQKKDYLDSSRFAQSLLRFDGSGYLAHGNITWNENGIVSIKDITTLIGENDTNVLNALTTFNNAFHFNTQSAGSTTVLSISPQVGFTSLNITQNGTLKPVATQEWVNANYLTIDFFDQLIQLHSGENGNPKIIANSSLSNYDSSKLNIKAMFGFWTEQYISALGQGSSSGGGGGSSIDMTTVWAAMADSTDTNQIALSHLTTALANYVTSSALATILADYLTSADLNGYATTSALNNLANSLAAVATSGSYNDLSDKPTIPTIPTNVSEFTNDAGYLKQQDISGKADKSEMSVTAGTGANADKTTIQLKSGTSATVLTQHQSLANYVDKTSAQSITGKKAFKEISFVEYGVQNGANPNAARMFNSADGWGGSAYIQLGGSNSGGNAENAIGFYILNRQWSNIILSLTNAGNFNISGTISEGGTQLSQKYLGINATASKATQLANSRTLWGQSFNGTQDVSGNMSGVGSLAMNGVLSGARGEIDAMPRNQVMNSDFRASVPNNWEGIGATAAYDATEEAICITKTDSNPQNFDFRTMVNNTTYIQGHKYICLAKVKGSTSGMKANVYDYNRVGYIGLNHIELSTSEYRIANVIASALQDKPYVFLVDGSKSNSLDVGIKMWIKWVQCIDLTAMFGAGNEPTTANEFARRLGYASIDDVPYIPYTATPTTLNNAVSLGGDLMVQGNKVILANGLVLNYNKSTNTLTFENTDGEPCNIVATGGVTALG